MSERTFPIEPSLHVPADNVILNPDHSYFKNSLRPYYVRTEDGQYLFGSTQKGRRPDRVFYLVPDSLSLGKYQSKFDRTIGKKFIQVVLDYLQTVPLIVQDGIQGEIGYKVGLRVTTSIRNPHSAYMAWMGRIMIFPPERDIEASCWNYIMPEGLPPAYVERIQKFWPEYNASLPLSLFDLTSIDKGIRRVFNIGVDYFGGAFKKPNLTMVWNKAEREGLISYHAGCTGDRVLKGLSGTGKTTLTVGPKLEQDDALLGLPLYDRNGKVGAIELIGLEAGSFAKSEGLTDKSPEWTGLMSCKDREGSDGPIVLAMNIDCENVEYRIEEIKGYPVVVPRAIDGKDVGSLQCTCYDCSGTTNGRFIFGFHVLNPKWGHNRLKILHTEGLAFKRFDMVEPIIRIIDPIMAVAFDSGCESIVTSAVSGKRPGTRIRNYAATDFLVGEQAEQAGLKLKVYSDLGLGVDGKLVFFITNSGYMGEHDFLGNRILVPENGDEGFEGSGSTNLRINEKKCGQGEKITVEDSKKLVSLVEDRRIENWIINPIFGYLVPDPKELEEVHGMKDYRNRFNPLRYYTPEQIQAFAERDIQERSEFLKGLFNGQRNAHELGEVIEYWNKIKIHSIEAIRHYYETLYGHSVNPQSQD